MNCLYSSFRRPVTIGVYGHPAHEVSWYSLLVYLVKPTSDLTDHFDPHGTNGSSQQNHDYKVF